MPAAIAFFTGSTEFEVPLREHHGGIGDDLDPADHHGAAVPEADRRRPDGRCRQGLSTDTHARGRGPNRVLTSTRAAVRIQAGHALLEVTALAPDVFRLGYFPHGRPVEYASEATDGAQWEPVEAEIHGESGGVEIDTEDAKAVVTLEPLRVVVRRPRRDGAGGRRAPVERRARPRPRGADRAAGADGPPADRAHALLRLRRADQRAGEDRLAPGVLEHRPAGRPHRLAQQPLHVDPVRARAAATGGRTACSSTTRTAVEIDLAKADPERGRATRPTGGDLVYYVFAGPTPRDVLDRYTRADRAHAAAAAVGARQPPVALGLQPAPTRCAGWRASSASATSRCDVLYLDIDYMDGYRVFTWDARALPGPGRR